MLRREKALWFLLAAGLFAFGWWRALNPEGPQIGYFGPATRLVIATLDRSLLKEEFLRDLSVEMGLPVHVEVLSDREMQGRLVLADGPDLVWGEVNQLQGFISQNIFEPIPRNVDLRRWIHSDFVTSRWSEHFIPILWEKKDGRLSVYGFSIGRNPRHQRDAWRLIDTMMEPEWGLRLSKESEKPSALRASDQSPLPYELRASRLRDL